jgi:hypothetical protein
MGDIHHRAVLRISFWVCSATGAVQTRRSTDAGATFQPSLTSPPITIAKGINIIRGVSNTGYLLNGLRAIIVPAIKWNAGAHNVMMAWHARTANELTNQTALYFLSSSPDTISSPSRCRHPTTTPPVTDSAGHRQRRQREHIGVLLHNHETFYWTFADALTSRWNTSWTRDSGGFDTMVAGVK